jgi:hypothetical protein
VEKKGEKIARVKYSEIVAEPAEPFSPELPDFSLILGGPLYQLLRRAHLSGSLDR